MFNGKRHIPLDNEHSFHRWMDCLKSDPWFIEFLLRPTLQMNHTTAKRLANSAGTAVFAAE
jgi:hypothetical protein